MKRFAEQELTQWLTSQHRKPLILRGARQVGKSTLVRQFAQAAQLELFEINLEEHTALDKVFKTNNVDAILTEIQFAIQKGGLINSPAHADQPQPLLFLDEIQATPHALPALRYLYEKRPDLAVIAAGSLLEFTLNSHHFSMPVGRIEYLFMGPMTFKEFLVALQEDALVELLENFQLGSTPFPESAHERLLDRLRQYLIIGGMPEPIYRFIHDGDTFGTQRAQTSILETYQDDFAKYGKHSELQHVRTLYDQLPVLTGTKVKYSNIDKHSTSRDIKNAITLLLQANILSAAYHSDANGIPISAQRDESIYKLFFLDVGLLNRSSRIEWLDIDELKSARFINEGPIAEQFIAQHLLRIGYSNETPRLHYWLREKRQSNAEVDFVWQHHREILPIEVKAGKSGSLRSLNQFVYRKSSNRAVRFDCNLPSVQQTDHLVRISRAEGGGGGGGGGGGTEAVENPFELISLPLYLVEELNRIL